jgi:hypothetical protein
LPTPYLFGEVNGPPSSELGPQQTKRRAGSSARSAAIETPHPLTGPRSNARTTPAFWREVAGQMGAVLGLSRMPGHGTQPNSGRETSASGSRRFQPFDRPRANRGSRPEAVARCRRPWWQELALSAICSDGGESAVAIRRHPAARRRAKRWRRITRCSSAGARSGAKGNFSIETLETSQAAKRMPTPARICRKLVSGDRDQPSRVGFVDVLAPEPGAP